MKKIISMGSLQPNHKGRLPNKVKLPQPIKYDGKGEILDHLYTFKLHVIIQCNWWSHVSSPQHHPYVIRHAWL